MYTASHSGSLLLVLFFQKHELLLMYKMNQIRQVKEVQKCSEVKSSHVLSGQCEMDGGINEEVCD